MLIFMALCIVVSIATDDNVVAAEQVVCSQRPVLLRFAGFPLAPFAYSRHRWLSLLSIASSLLLSRPLSPPTTPSLLFIRSIQ